MMTPIFCPVIVIINVIVSSAPLVGDGGGIVRVRRGGVMKRAAIAATTRVPELLLRTRCFEPITITEISFT